MAKRFLTMAILFAFVFSTLSACVMKHVPPGHIKKQTAPGQLKKKNH